MEDGEDAGGIEAMGLIDGGPTMFHQSTDLEAGSSGVQIVAVGAANAA